MTNIPYCLKNIKYFIYCSGKSGSTTLDKTFKMKYGNDTTLHVHSVKNFKFSLKKKMFRGIYDIVCNNPNYIKECENKNFNLFELIERNSEIQEDIYIIDSYRNPIERKISAFFHHIKNHVSDYEKKNIEELIDYFNKNFLNIIEEYHSIDEILNQFKIPNFKKFDFKKKYNYTKYKNIHFIKLRFADINEWDKILSEIMKTNINIVSDNKSEDKKYYDKYQKFKKMYCLPIYYLSKIKNNIYFNIYNSLNEKLEYLYKHSFFNNLFNKYDLNIRKPTEPINYNLIKRCKINKKLLCHVHCYNIDKFTEIFGNYISNLKKYFSVIVTYSKGEYIPSYDINILKIVNRGVDIGAKICCLKYIQDENIDYENILFLHSKTDIKKRLEYFNPLIGSEDIIIKNINLLQENDAIFNNIHKGYDLTSEYISNRYYHKEFLDFLGVSYKNEMEYSEGNCMFLSKKIVDFIFTSNLQLFYNILNTKDDFDISWVKGRYGKSNISNEILYNDYKNNVEYMDLNKNGKAVGNNFGNFSNDMPDGMIEHIFERIYINVIKHLNLDYLVQVF